MHHFRKQIAACTIFVALALTGTSFAQSEDEATNSASDHLLQAEIALHDDNYIKAVREYRIAAELSDSIEIARQATRLAFDLGFNDEARLAAQRWRELEPDSDEALIHLGQIQLRRGNARDARRHFKLLIERGDEDPEARLMSLMSFFGQEDPVLVDELIRDLAKPYLDTALGNYAVAAAALQADDMEVAREYANVAISLDPDWLKAKLLYARILLLDGEGDEAIDYTARIIGDDPDPDPDARMELALMYMTAGRDDDALSQINQVLLERASRTDALRMMAIINFRQNNLDAAWDDFEDLLASGDYTADALYYLARIADFRGQPDRAIRLYSQVVAGTNAVASQRRASALMAFENDDVDGALRRLNEFANSRPRYAIDMLIAQAQLLSSLGRNTEALETFGKAVEFRPDNEAIALGRAELLLRMDQVPEAVSAYRDAAKRWPDSAMTLNALGYTLADRTEEYRDAEKFIRRALKLDPESPAITDSLGWVLHKRGKHAEALVQLEVAFEQFPDPEVAAHIVEVLAALERKDEALEALVTAEARDPESELLKDVRERLFPESP